MKGNFYEGIYMQQLYSIFWDICCMNKCIFNNISKIQIIAEYDYIQWSDPSAQNLKALGSSPRARRFEFVIRKQTYVFLNAILC